MSSAPNTKAPLWHTLTDDETLAHLKGNAVDGLSEAEVVRRRQQHGLNQLTRKTGHGPLVTFLLQFHQPLVYILLVAAGVTFVLHEYVDAAVIAGVVLINAIVGFIQEDRAAKAIDALANSMVSMATVRRGGRVQRVASPELVPGDLVQLQSGDQVPADLRLLRVKDLRTAEAALTGESLPVSKGTKPLPADTVLAERTNLAFGSALVTSGQATGVVVATGDQTEVGKIQRLIQTAQDLSTPLTREINRFSLILMWVILGVAVFTFVAGYFQGQTAIDMFHASVALAVGAIPEGLPAAVTVVLAIGVWRMAGRNAVIRKLPAVEALGSTAIICSDKTGTLTENEMTVQQLWVDGQTYRVAGVGYAPEGGIVPKPTKAALDCLQAGMLCSDSHLSQKEGRWLVDGDPTEGALLVAARKAGFAEATLAQSLPRLDVIPFESDHQYMATLHDRGAGQPRLVYLKGSVERVLARCALEEIAAVHQAVEAMGAQGLRVLAFAVKELPANQSTLDHADVAEGMTLLGLQGMMDPPRPEAIRAVAACRSAGVQVKMITGDHATTAAAIAAQLGLSERQANGALPPVLNGQQLAEIADADLPDAALRTDVFARVTPEQKLRLVKALQTGGRVVAMTGDGVNDAPALKQADIGVAMGITGTEVAKDAADMVLTDDNFASIVAAVEEGRGVFDNLVKFLVWTLPTNIGEGLVILVAVLLGVTLPILPVQILWINMTTAVLLGMTLTFEPKETDLMRRRPRPAGSAFLSAALVRRMGLVGLAMLAGAFGLFQYERLYGAAAGTDQADKVARTVAVNVFVLVETVYLFNCRHLRRSMLEVRDFGSNPWTLAGAALMILCQLAFTYLPAMHSAFHTAPITLESWFRILLVSVAVFVLVDLEIRWANGGDRGER